MYKDLLDHVHWHSCTYLFIFCDRSWRHHGLSQSHNPDKPKTMTIKNFLFSTVPNILYELGASAKVGSLVKWVNKPLQHWGDVYPGQRLCFCVPLHIKKFESKHLSKTLISLSIFSESWVAALCWLWQMAGSPDWASPSPCSRAQRGPGSGWRCMMRWVNTVVTS